MSDLSTAPAVTLTPQSAAPPQDLLRRVALRSFVVGLVCFVALVAGGLANKEQFVRSWLPAYFVWFGVSLGSLAVLMLQAMTRGSWGVVVRRPLEAATRTLPIVALGLIPLILGRQVLYPWARPDAVAASHMLQHQQPWMSLSWVIGRAVLFFGLWILMAFLLNRMSAQQDATGDPFLPVRMQKVAGPGLVLYALSVSFFGVDWLMSLNANWFSSIFGFYMMGSQALAAFSFVLVVLWMLASAGTLPELYQPRHLHDIGKLLFAFVLVWAYFSVSQFLIIWSGNLPEEISWYYVRMGPAWKGLSLAVVLLHFVLPFGLLLSADIKKDARRLGPVALFLLAMRWLDLYWQAAPALSPSRFTIHWMDLVAFVGIGGIWTGLFLWQLGKRSLAPLNDPFLPEALTHHG